MGTRGLLVGQRYKFDFDFLLLPRSSSFSFPPQSLISSVSSTTVPVKMKYLLPVLLATSALAAPTAAPAPADEGVSFPITDLIDSDLTFDEYAAQLEAEQSASSASLAKRQYNGDTFNQLTDGTACRPISVIYARGTNGAGNVGEAGSEGPTFFNALASRLGGASRLAIQGVNYSASVLGFLAGGDSAGGTTMTNLIAQTVTRCPNTKIVVSGYSQGAQLVHTATQRLTAAQAARVNAGT